VVVGNLAVVPIRVALVDDVADVRRLVRIALKLRGGFDVVAEADDGRSAIEVVVAERPDVVVLDLGLPDLAGSEVVSRIRDGAPDTKIVVFTGIDLGPGELGDRVDAVVRKDEDVLFLVDLLDVVSSGDGQLASTSLAADTASPGEARRFVERTLEDWSASSVLDAALLVVSELVTNAVVHAASASVLRLGRTPTSVRIEVSDNGTGSPEPHVATDDLESGRGLLLVAAVSAAWGVESTVGGGKRVWAELPLDVDQAS
jgi:CheY-like chemotaxis protein/anti-sigma regulatory factor (Ser/Thr protein kinase)